MEQTPDFKSFPTGQERLQDGKNIVVVQDGQTVLIRPDGTRKVLAPGDLHADLS